MAQDRLVVGGMVSTRISGGSSFWEVMREPDHKGYLVAKRLLDGTVRRLHVSDVLVVTQARR